ESIETLCKVTMEKKDTGFEITESHLEVTARIPGADNAKFEAAANEAKAGCPIRIVQRKMSMKLAKWRERFPMQDEHEKGKNGVGVARPGASVYAECREPEPGSDPRVFTVERGDRVHQRRAGRTIPVGGRGIGRAEVRGCRKRRGGI